MMKFPPSFIERLRSSVTISEVVGRRVSLKKRGREFMGLCPFHKEKSPSFTVNDDKGFYHCFGCGAHGDAISFVMKHDGMRYPEAIEFLCRETGIAMPELTPEEEQKIEHTTNVQAVLEAACQYFEKQLVGSKGMTALDYAKGRGLKDSTLRQFRMGYTPDERQGLYAHLRNENISEALMLEAGLIIKTDQGVVYDRFRGRLMFAIRNPSGKVVAFGGRLLDSNANPNQPKYLNSPETTLFKKGELLYNLDLAKRPARAANRVVVMEGYMDVVATTQYGVDCAVATLGTAVTAPHLRMLWQLAKEPILCLDGDAAGARAMMRAAEVALPLLKPGYSLRFVTLPQGDDPDSYIQKHGKASFDSLLGGAPRLSQMLWDTLHTPYNLNAPEERAALEDACKKLANTIEEPTVKAHYLDYFRKQLWNASHAHKKEGGMVVKSVKTRSPLIEQMVASHRGGALDTLGKRLLLLLMQFPALLHNSQIEETLARIDIIDPKLNALRQALLAAPTQHITQNALIEYVEAHLPDFTARAWMESVLAIDMPKECDEKQAAQLWQETLAAYHVTSLEIELEDVQKQMSQTMSESQLQRMVELQNALRKAQQARQFGVTQEDVA